MLMNDAAELKFKRNFHFLLPHPEFIPFLLNHPYWEI
jgi:hypothetical protein